MICQRCGSKVDKEEVRELNGQALCEDCYMDALSPARPCDPWAAMAAKSVSQFSGGEAELTEVQQRILDAMAQGPLPLEELAQGSGLEPDRLERELATLHRMEKVGARLVGGVRRYELWIKED